MPLGSSSAAPVMRPGPSVFHHERAGLLTADARRTAAGLAGGGGAERACRAAAALFAIELAQQLALALLQTRAELCHVHLGFAAGREELLFFFLDVMPDVFA